MISYDIAKPDAPEYEPIWSLLRKWDAQRILYSQWVVTSPPGQAANMYGEIAPLITPKDRLLVIEVARDASWDRLMMPDDDFRKIMYQSRM